MSLIVRLTSLEPAERHVLMEAAITVPLVRLALLVLPFRVVHRAIGGVMSRSRSHRDDGATPARIARMVAAVAVRVPRASCLTQALAAAMILARHGHPSTVRIGVARGDASSLKAHAWLESGGEIVLGGPDVGAFVSLPPLSLETR